MRSYLCTLGGLYIIVRADNAGEAKTEAARAFRRGVTSTTPGQRRTTRHHPEIRARRITVSERLRWESILSQTIDTARIDDEELPNVDEPELDL